MEKKIDLQKEHCAFVDEHSMERKGYNNFVEELQTADIMAKKVGDKEVQQPKKKVCKKTCSKK